MSQFDTIHLDLYFEIFNYLAQNELINILLINRMFYQQVMKYIDRTLFENKNFKYKDCYGITTYKDIERIEAKIKESEREFDKYIISFYKKTNYSYTDVSYVCNIRNYKLTIRSLNFILHSGIDSLDIAYQFSLACRSGSLPIVKYIYNIIQSNNELRRDLYGLTIFSACNWGRQSVVDFLNDTGFLSYCGCEVHYTNHPGIA